jgi:hypothetical protein
MQYSTLVQQGEATKAIQSAKAGIANVGVGEFLSPFRFDYPDALIHVRRLTPKGVDAAQYPPQLLTFRQKNLIGEHAERNLVHLNQSEMNPRANYFFPNIGGVTNDAITDFSAVFVEFDAGTHADQHAALDRAERRIKTSVRVETRRGVQAFFFLTPGATREEWVEVQSRLYSYFENACPELKPDSTLGDPAQMMRLPFYDHVQVTGDGVLEARPVRLVQFEPKRRYAIGDVLSAFPAENQHRTSHRRRLVAREPRPGYILPAQIAENRNVCLAKLSGKLRTLGLTSDEFAPTVHAVNQNPDRMPNPLSEKEVNAICKSVGRYETEGNLPMEPVGRESVGVNELTFVLSSPRGMKILSEFIVKLGGLGATMTKDESNPPSLESLTAGVKVAGMTRTQHVKAVMAAGICGKTKAYQLVDALKGTR